MGLLVFVLADGFGKQLLKQYISSEVCCGQCSNPIDHITLHCSVVVLWQVLPGVAG